MKNMTNEKPQIAILTENTLEALGIAAVIERMMPSCETRIFTSPEEMQAHGGSFFHYFVSSHILMHRAAAIRRLPHVVVLSHGEDNLPLQGLHTFNVCCPEKELVRQILTLAHTGHRRQSPPLPETCNHTAKLTRRETDVLKLIVRGLLNKEIAASLGIALTTVITHRKNLSRKLGTRSVSSLTIYAVTHGIVNINEI